MEASTYMRLLKISMRRSTSWSKILPHPRTANIFHKHFFNNHQFFNINIIRYRDLILYSYFWTSFITRLRKDIFVSLIIERENDGCTREVTAVISIEVFILFAHHSELISRYLNSGTNESDRHEKLDKKGDASLANSFVYERLSELRGDSKYWNSGTLRFQKQIIYLFV